LLFQVEHAAKKSPSWQQLHQSQPSAHPAEIQDEVRAGRVAPHAAMKYLLPLASANAQAAAMLSAAIAPLNRRRYLPVGVRRVLAANAGVATVGRCPS
jgi:hypothetical protein